MYLCGEVREPPIGGVAAKAGTTKGPKIRQNTNRITDGNQDTKRL